MRPLGGSDAVLICLNTPVAGLSADGVAFCFSSSSFAIWFMVCDFRDVQLASGFSKVLIGSRRNAEFIHRPNSIASHPFIEPIIDRLLK
jgi:hypothetical protein